MSVAKYKIGQEVQTSDGDRHIVEEIRHRYVVWRVYAVPMPGVRPGIGCLNNYDEADLTPYVRPLAVGDRVRWNRGRLVVEVICIKDNDAWVDNEGNRFTACIADLERIPTEAGQ